MVNLTPASIKRRQQKRTPLPPRDAIPTKGLEIKAKLQARNAATTPTTPTPCKACKALKAHIIHAQPALPANMDLFYLLCSHTCFNVIKHSTGYFIMIISLSIDTWLGFGDSDTSFVDDAILSPVPEWGTDVDWRQQQGFPHASSLGFQDCVLDRARNLADRTQG